jgi:hypothetical protein
MLYQSQLYLAHCQVSVIYINTTEEIPHFDQLNRKGIACPIDYAFANQAQLSCLYSSASSKVKN